MYLYVMHVFLIYKSFQIYERVGMEHSGLQGTNNLFAEQKVKELLKKEKIAFITPISLA